tara:strand:- start:330 stop:923 length:594 start_codon:yes stop_codon:yes gene_type:complete
MPSVIQADQLKSADGVTTYLNSGTLSNLTFPAGHVIQVNQVIDQSIDERSGNKSSWISTGVSCTLPNNLKNNSKLFVMFSGNYGESEGNHYGSGTVFSIFQNSTNICGNQLSSLNSDKGLARVSMGNNTANYEMNHFSGSIYFTPTGTDTAKRTVELQWRSTVDTSYSSYLNRMGQSGTDVWSIGGATIITVMEVAQ